MHDTPRGHCGRPWVSSPDRRAVKGSSTAASVSIAGGGNCDERPCIGAADTPAWEYAGPRSRGPATESVSGAAATASGQQHRGGGVRPKGWHSRRGVRRHGDTPAPPQLRVGYLNIDGLTATKVAAVVQRLRPGGLHVLLLAETKLTQASQREMNTLITLASRGRGSCTADHVPGTRT